VPDPQPLHFRIAQPRDLPRLAVFDPRWTDDRRLRIEQAALELRCWVVAEPDAPDQPLGFGLLSHDWFGRPLLELLVVHPEHLRVSAGPAFLDHLVAAAGWPGMRVFAAANQGDAAMRQLLERGGFVESGIIHNLHDGAPVLIYVKLSPPL
jgi:hypothetical protein